MARTRRFIAVMALVAVPLAACSNQDADAQDVSSSLKEAGATSDQADCAAEGLTEGTDKLTQEQLNEVAKADDLADLDSDLQTKVNTVMDGCFGAGPEGETSEGEGEGSTTTTTAEGSTTTAP